MESLPTTTKAGSLYGTRAVKNALCDIYLWGGNWYNSRIYEKWKEKVVSSCLEEGH